MDTVEGWSKRRAGDGTALRGRRREMIALLGVSLAFFMIVLDSTVVNVAVFAIKSDLSTSAAELQWIVNGYTVAFAALLLTAGIVGDRIGAKRIFLAGLVLFATASGLCSEAPSIDLLVAGRILQGLGAAAIMPTSLALITHAYPDPRGRARAIGLWAGVAGPAITCGPIIGGLLIDAFGWRSIFRLNVPVAAVSLVIAWLYVKETPRSSARAFDPFGQIIAIAALAIATSALIEGGRVGWHAGETLGGLALTLILFGAFWVVERRAKAPMVPPALFANHAFTVANAVGFSINFGLYGLLFVLSLFFETLLHYSAPATGVAFLPLTVTMALTVIPSGRLTGRFGPRRPMLVGLSALFVSCVIMALTISRQSDVILAGIGFILFGGGFGLTMPAMTAVVMSNAPSDLAGTASGVLSATRQVGGAMGVALLGALAADSRLASGVGVDIVLVGITTLASLVLTWSFVRSRSGCRHTSRADHGGRDRLMLSAVMRNTSPNCMSRSRVAALRQR